MIHFGVVKPGSTLRIPFDSFAAATGAPSALSNFAVGDILIYKDGSTTERASTTGYTATTTFDSVTGLNEAVIDLSSDATGDFFKSGSNYTVAISPVTIDGQTMAFWAASFSIGYPDAVLNTSIATLASQTSFTLTSGPAEDDALNGLWCLIHDKASAVQITWARVSDYTGSTKTVTLETTPATTFTIAAIDNIHFFGTQKVDVGWINSISTSSVNAVAAKIGTSIAPTFSVNNNIKADVQDWVGASVLTPATVGLPDCNVKNINNVSASAVTTVKAVQGLAVDGVITTLTNLPAITANWLTAAGTAADFGTEVAAAVWGDTVAGDFTVASSVGKSVMNGVALGTGLTVNAVTGLTASDVGSIKTKTDSLTFTVANKVDSNTYTWNGTAVSAPATAGIPEVNVKNIANAAVSTTSAQIGVNVVQISTDATAADNAESFFDGTGYAGTNNVIPLVTTATNLTNAPTAGDFTATMKTSIGTAVAASAVASVTAPVTIAASQLFVKKNTQLTSFMFKMVLTSDHVTAATGITVAVARAIDGGAFSASTNTPATEISNGWYKITLSAGDLNGTLIAFKATGTGCDQRDILIVTQA